MLYVKCLLKQAVEVSACHTRGCCLSKALFAGCHSCYCILLFRNFLLLQFVASSSARCTLGIFAVASIMHKSMSLSWLVCLECRCRAWHAVKCGERSVLTGL